MGMVVRVVASVYVDGRGMWNGVHGRTCCVGMEGMVSLKA
jgi:hypothetical protein